jgi:predicted  nucleic acid-binding Zn-ribbon protein
MNALPDVEEVRKAAKRVAAIQTDIASAKQRLATLEQQLGVTFDQFELVLKTALKPQAKVQRRRPTSKGQPK